MPEHSLEEINAMSLAAFSDAFGDIYEHSPWIAEKAWEARPFGSAEAVRNAMAEAVRAAPEDRQIALLNAHPELAGREARSGNLTEASSQEQAGAGLVDLSAEELERVASLNRAYREKFGFPFIIAVRNHTKSTILQAMERRLANDRQEELATALEQVFEIARIRLESLL